MTRPPVLVSLLFLVVGLDGCHSTRRRWSGEPATTCVYGGIRRQVGTVFRSTDGCNDCSCGTNGQAICTTRACLSDGGLSPDAPRPDVGTFDSGARADGGTVTDRGNTPADHPGMFDVAVTADGAGEPSPFACSYGSGIGRTLIARRDSVRGLCIVLLLDRPGTNPFALALPGGLGVEAAYAAPAAGSDCQWVTPPAGAVSATAVTGAVTVRAFSVDVDATLTFPAADGGRGSERIVATALDTSPVCSGGSLSGPAGDGGGVDLDEGAPVSTLTIDFPEPGARVLPAQWLVFQPNESGSVDVATEIGTSWATHPRVVEAQSLSLCGGALKTDEAIRNLEAAGFPETANPALANLRSIQISEVSPASFCAGVHHASGSWTFLPAPVQPTVDAASGLATGSIILSEDDVDLVAVLFQSDSRVRAIQYQTWP